MPEKVQELVRMIEKGCHTINTIRNPVPVSGKVVHNGEGFDVQIYPHRLVIEDDVAGY